MNKIIIGFLVLIAGLVVGWFARGYAPQMGSEETREFSEVTPTPGVTLEVSGEEATGGATGGEKGAVVATAAVQYTANGFTPATLTVRKGTTVVFTNSSTAGMWVASDVHPTHQLLSGFDQRESVGAGGTYRYTFAVVGTWRYHDHVNPQRTGTVVVTE
jgi:plastocyanin